MARRDVQAKNETKLGRLRTERGVSQEELAEAVGISLATYRRLERGQLKNPPVRYLVNCAIALGVELEEILEPEWLEWMPTGVKTAKPPDPEQFWQPGRYLSWDELRQQRRS